MRFEEVTRGLYLEGLCPDSDGVWVADPVRGGIRHVRADGSTREYLPEKQWIGSLMLNSDGRLLVSGEGGISWLDGATGETGVLLDSIGGHPIPGVNEMVADSDGGIYFGTIDIPAIARGEPPGPSTLYRLAPDGRVTELCAGLKFANGVGISPDGRRLYLNETFGDVWAFDIAADGKLENRRVILAKPDGDGMAIDEEGTVWITGYKSSALTLLHSDGTPKGEVELPAGGCTSIRFGGADRRDLYVNMVPMDAGDRIAVGDLPSTDESVCYRARAEVAGLGGRMPAFRTR
jgi:sugar lactone lactonase YvrE